MSKGVMSEVRGRYVRKIIKCQKKKKSTLKKKINFVLKKIKYGEKRKNNQLYTQNFVVIYSCTNLRKQIY